MTADLQVLRAELQQHRDGAAQHCEQAQSLEEELRQARHDSEVWRASLGELESRCSQLEVCQQCMAPSKMHLEWTASCVCILRQSWGLHTPLLAITETTRCMCVAPFSLLSSVHTCFLDSWCSNP